MIRLWILVLLTLHCNGYSQPATSHTAEANQAMLSQLPFQNQQDFEEINRGFIAPLPNNGIIRNSKGEVVWDLSKYAFLNTDEPAPNSVNPSLWRQGRLLWKSGLFKVTEGIYQVRGADVSNMTIIEGKSGIIIIDPLVSQATAKAALELYYENRPKRPITTVLYTHSHIDHFGGVKGVISQDDVDSGKIRIYAPEGFTEAALEENVMAGNAMGRRASYMYGNLLKPGPEGQMTSGLGMTTSSGEPSLILPTDLISKTGQEATIDGIKFVFLFAPDSEAPAEMLFYLPEFKAIGSAEDASHTMHNLYTLRGAKVRDARLWAKYLNQTIDLFGSQADVIFGQHHWPIWGRESVIDFLEKQRDLYKYIHDQTLRLANQGYTMIEIAEMIKLPESLAKEWYNRGYYGSLNHNAKAVYDFYLGWFDGNPSTLHQLPPTEASKKYLEYMGGANSVIEKAREDYNKGNYRWAAQVLNHVVFADPNNKDAKALLANTLEQMGFQTENGPWRNFYLTGAKELREGIRHLPAPSPASPDIIAAMPTHTLFDYLAIRLDGIKASTSPMVLNVNLPDLNQKYVLQIKNGVLNHYAGKNSKHAIATASINRSDFDDVILGKVTAEQLIKSKKLTIEGNKSAIYRFLGLLDKFEFWFPIVTPR
ncbi:MAG: alkyl sulfatase dimerization domain-containing protein [Chlamydiales bacterium]|nr:alkyl sulfatase dimerization domain-containing protein [Chlamydiales bacterium]